MQSVFIILFKSIACDLSTKNHRKILCRKETRLPLPRDIYSFFKVTRLYATSLRLVKIFRKIPMLKASSVLRYGRFRVLYITSHTERSLMQSVFIILFKSIACDISAKKSSKNPLPQGNAFTASVRHILFFQSYVSV